MRFQGEDVFLGQSDAVRPGTIRLGAFFDGAGAPGTINFNYRGTPVIDANADGVSDDVPYVVGVFVGDAARPRKCVVVATLLGTVKTVNSQGCDNFITFEEP